MEVERQIQVRGLVAMAASAGNRAVVVGEAVLLYQARQAQAGKAAAVA